ncbi:DUF7289 family protein [Natronobiforma cellulositropha]|uniref:DUF7289 family protein n=1 Tax=Natronobiforma cellulositropha TaxID=1679076 RepID=UPI0021D584B2|nr:polymer-forming cytoskeletal protein [Natronobiforma cellulositropha]
MTPSRAQTAVLGLVVLLGVVAVASVGILLVAGESSSGLERQAEAERVESAFLEMSKEIETATASRDVTRSVTVDVEPSNGEIRLVERGEIDVSIDDESIFETGPVALRAVEYTSNDGSTIAYEGGGVWRSSGEAVQVRSEPNLYLSDGTLTLPIQTFTANGEFRGGSASVTSTEITSRYSGLVEDGEEVTVTVSSQYYRGWERYFESIGAGNVSVSASGPDGVGTVSATYDVDGLPEEPSGGLPIDPSFEEAVSVDGPFSMKGTQFVGDVSATDDVVLESNSVDGTIVTAGDVHVTSQTGEVTGSIIAEGSVTMEGHTRVHGDIVAGGNTYGSDSGHIHGDVVVYGTHGFSPNYQIDGDLVTDPDGTHPHPESLTGDNERVLLDDDIERMVASGDESEFRTLTGGETLTAGTHYIDSIDLGGGQVELDVGDGDVHLIVRDDIEVNQWGGIHVTNHEGGNVAQLFTAGDLLAGVGGGGGFEFCPATNGNCDETATPLQLYGTSEMTVSFNQHSRLHGIVYAPGAAFEGDNYGHIFGSVTVGSFVGDNNMNYEYDGELEHGIDQPTDPTGGEPEPDPEETESAGLDEVRYLHATTYEITLVAT